MNGLSESDAALESQLMAALSAPRRDWIAVVTLVQRYGPRATRMPLTSEMRTILHFVAMEDRSEYVGLLRERGAKLDAVDADGFTALHYTGLGRLRNHVNTARELIRAGANVDAIDSDGETLLHIASCFGHASLVRLLLEHGADVHRRNYSTGQTALHWSCVFAHREVARVLLEYGADLNAVTHTGETPSFMASWRGHEDFVAWLRMYSGRPRVQRTVLF